MSSLDKRFQVGDRCRLSELGRKRNPKRGIGLCEVVSFGNSSQRIRIRFVGYRSVHTMHASYLERVPEPSEGWLWRAGHIADASVYDEYPVLETAAHSKLSYEK